MSLPSCDPHSIFVRFHLPQECIKVQQRCLGAIGVARDARLLTRTMGIGPVVDTRVGGVGSLGAEAASNAFVETKDPSARDWQELVRPFDGYDLSLCQSAGK